MAIATKKSNWQIWATVGFALLLLLNVGLCALAVGMALKGDGHPWTVFPEDSPAALRFGVFLFGVAAAWLCGRQMLGSLVSGEIAVSDAVTAAWGVTIYFLLFFIGMTFAGTIHWALLLVLLLFVLIFTVPVFWRLVGGTRTVWIVVISLLLGGVAVYLLSRG
jgi:hypothetical protein